jgi:serine protease
MRSVKSLSRWITLGLVLASVGGLAAPPQKSGPGRLMRADNPVTGEYLVVLKEKPGRGLSNMAAKAGALASQYGARVLTTHETAFRGLLVSASEVQAQALAEDPRVDYVLENGIVQPSGVQSPADWNLDRIDQESRPLDNSYLAEDATGVNVYVIDSGIRASHLEFAGRAQVVFNAVPNQTGDDVTGHGTAVAGIIGGKTHGVAKKVNLRAVKAFNEFGTTVDRLVTALEWVANNAVTPAIVNLSFTAASEIPAIDAAVDVVAMNPGLVVVIAAGNANVDACGCSPARLQPDAGHPFRTRIITVGAIDESQARWVGVTNASNTGACLDLWAPGANLRSVSSTSDTDSTFFPLEGTSFAAPHVSGVAAILLANGVAPADIPARLINDASVGQVELDFGDTSSPNRLLYKRPHATPLVNGAGVSVSDVTGGRRNFKLDVPAGRPSVTFSISGGTGDADLYIRHGQFPELHAYQCRPLRKGNNETCVVNNPAGGTWLIQLGAFSTYTTTLKGQY